MLNVGAGTGNYEPADRQVTALEPSAEMIAQRPPGSARVVQGHAEALPFADNSFDAAMAVLTVHHWNDQPKGLSEMCRVAKGPVVILTFDPDGHEGWLGDYLPELIELDGQIMPPLGLTNRRWARSKSRQCLCQRIVPTDSSRLTGNGPKPISIQVSEAESRRSG